jgi:hypothetical protein
MSVGCDDQLATFADGEGGTIFVGIGIGVGLACTAAGDGDRCRTDACEFEAAYPWMISAA